MSVISAEGRQLHIRDASGLERARRAVRQLAEVARLSPHRRVCLLAAARELADNVLRHGGGGSLDVTVIERHGVSGVRCVFSDRGNGIGDLAQALRAGNDAGVEQGRGLPGARSLVDEFRIRASAPTGTTVEIVMWACAGGAGTTPA
jgi:serine/threonine-protein kinase RsbT